MNFKSKDNIFWFQILKNIALVYTRASSTPGTKSMPGARSVSAEKSLTSSRAVLKGWRRTSCSQKINYS